MALIMKFYRTDVLLKDSRAPVSVSFTSIVIRRCKHTPHIKASGGAIKHGCGLAIVHSSASHCNMC